MKRTAIALVWGAAALALGAAAIGGWWVAAHWKALRANAALRSRVAAVPFTPPAAGVVPEERLRVFLEVCRRTEAVTRRYQDARADLRSANEHGAVDLNALAGGMAYVEEVQLERARALESAGMGMREMRWIVLRLGEDDAVNARLFGRYATEIARCIDVKNVQKDLDAYRRAIREGSP